VLRSDPTRSLSGPSIDVKLKERKKEEDRNKPTLMRFQVEEASSPPPTWVLKPESSVVDSALPVVKKNWADDSSQTGRQSLFDRALRKLKAWASHDSENPPKHHPSG